MSQLTLAAIVPDFLDAVTDKDESLLDLVRDVADLHGHEETASAMGRPRQSLSAALHPDPSQRNRKRIYLDELPALLALDVEHKIINHLVALTVGRHAVTDLLTAAMETLDDSDIVTPSQRKSFLRSMKSKADRLTAMKRALGGAE